MSFPIGAGPPTGNRPAPPPGSTQPEYPGPPGFEIRDGVVMGPETLATVLRPTNRDLPCGQYAQPIGMRPFDREPFVTLTPDAPTTPLCGDNPANIRATCWRDAKTCLVTALRRGDVKVLLLDLDNALFQPKGFLGSEAWEWLCTRTIATQRAPIALTNLRTSFPKFEQAVAQARRTVLNARDKLEPLMATNDFFEIPWGGTVAMFEEIREAANAHDVPVLGLTARPEKYVRDQTIAALRAAGIGNRENGDAGPALLDRVIFADGKGDAKLRKIRKLADTYEAPINSISIVDDLEHNTHPLRQAGVSTILLRDDEAMNHAGVTTAQYVSRAVTAASGPRYFHLLNALVAASTQDAFDYAVVTSRNLLQDPTDEQVLFEHALSLQALARGEIAHQSRNPPGNES